MTVLKTNDLKKSFGKFTALDGVNLQVNEGEVYGFIGPNGAGKTTTIRILLGIYKASNGSATIFGRDVWKDAVEIHKRLAYVPGDVNLWANLTGGEVIDFFLRIGGSNNTKRKKELIERFDLDPTKKCRTYSKGNRQKVALIAAFASEADLYILDEPTSGLDPLMENVFQECVSEVKMEGKSILLSSHILSEVEKLCDKVSIIRKGKVIEAGTLDQLRHLTRTNISVLTEQPLGSLEEITGIFNIQRDGKNLSFQVDTDEVGSIINYISQYDIQKLEVTPLALEDLFKHYYEGTGGNR